MYSDFASELPSKDGLRGDIHPACGGDGCTLAFDSVLVGDVELAAEDKELELLSFHVRRGIEIDEDIVRSSNTTLGRLYRLELWVPIEIARVVS